MLHDVLLSIFFKLFKYMNGIEDLFKYMKDQQFDRIISLLKNDTDNMFELNAKDKQGNYLLTYAVLFNKLDIVQLLVTKGAKIDIVDMDERSVLYIAIKYDYTTILEYLLKTNRENIGISIIDIRDRNSNIPLHYAINNNNLNAVKILLEYGSNPNTIDKNGNNSLHLAVYSRSKDICEVVLKYNPNINSKTNIGETALHIACNLQNMEIIKLLLRKKDINVNSQDFEHEFTPLHYSINLNNAAQVDYLLQNKADPIIQDIYGNTPIHYCITENNIKILDFLLHQKSGSPNINIWNIEGKIPLHYVFETIPDNITEYIDKLIEDSNLNIQDNDGNTCLHLLIKHDMWQQYKSVLEKKKLDITLINKNNKRPLDYVKKNNMDEFVSIVANSYLYRLRNKKDNWKEDWENICTKELVNTVTKEEKEIIKSLNITIKSGEDACIAISKKKIYEIINNQESKCGYKSFPVTRSYICAKIGDDQNIGVCTFTGSTLDILIGLIYLLKKHNDVCGTVNKEFYKNNDLCKMYESMGISMNARCEFLNFEIIWVNNKLYLHDNFYDNFSKCMSSSKKRFIIIPLGIEMKQGSHANYLIFDKTTNEIERFEPHGSGAPHGFNYNANMMDGILETKIKEIDNNIKYIAPKEFLPKIGFQLLDIYENKNKRIGDPGGFCALWGIWYVDMRITYKDIERKQLVKILIQQIKSNNISFKNMIRNYGKNVINIRDSILNKYNIDVNDWLNDKITDEQIDDITRDISSEIYKLTNK